MNLPTLVDVAIGLCLIYLSASLWVTILNEFIAQKLELRGKQLAADLTQLIDCAKVREILGENPALAGFFDPSKGSRSYVDPKVLAQHLVGGLQIAKEATADVSATAEKGPAGLGGIAKEGTAGMAAFLESVDALPESGFKRQLQALVRAGSTDIATLTNNVSVWIDQTLTMMGERYKRKLQLISFSIGLVLAVGFNLDTVGIVKHLYGDKVDREAIVAMATDLVDKIPKEVMEKCRKLDVVTMRGDTSCAGVREFLDGLRRREGAFGRLPIGWPIEYAGSASTFLTAPIGWLLTALAISLGASFWFDLLNRLVNMRHGMRKPEAAKDEQKAQAT